MKKWCNSFKEKTQITLREEDSNIDRIYGDMDVGNLCGPDLCHVRSLESLRHSIFEEKEATWRLRSCSI
jgi:hypothetical protein